MFGLQSQNFQMFWSKLISPKDKGKTQTLKKIKKIIAYIFCQLNQFIPERFSQSAMQIVWSWKKQSADQQSRHRLLKFFGLVFICLNFILFADLSITISLFLKKHVKICFGINAILKFQEIYSPRDELGLEFFHIIDFHYKLQ